MSRRWKIAIGTFCGVAAAASIYAALAVGVGRSTRRPAVAGQFYPADPKVLFKQVRGFLAVAKGARGTKARTIAVIAPHAGYEFSGRTAGVAFRWLDGAAPRRVVVIGPSHGPPAAPAWVDDVDAYAIPGAKVPVDREAVKVLEREGLPAIAGAADHEHSIEVELPFLVEVLKPGWKLVPVLTGSADLARCRKVADSIKHVLNDATVVCVSSDFTHYGPPYGYVPFKGTDDQVRQKLAALDGGAVERITAKDAEGFYKYFKKTGATICGRGPIMVLLSFLPGDASGREVAYATSGEVSGSYSVSVSYAAVVFTVAPGKTAIWGKPEKESKTMSEPSPLTKEEKATLLAIARASLRSNVVEGKSPDISAFDLTDTLKEKRGAFVTLTEKGKLRGCIGYVKAIKPLWQAVMENAANAALHDPRFPRVKSDELSTIHIEISAMSPLRTISDPGVIEVGKHGIMLTKGPYAGLLLPQVATEYGWDREEFLKYTCRKAGLPDDAWKDPATKIEIFSAEVFGEEEK